MHIKKGEDDLAEALQLRRGSGRPKSFLLLNVVVCAFILISPLSFDS